ncbi:Endonuclease/exonuclease/phosphatase,Reverse transcriptase domain [Cinara cedri]|uniref:Endonuclease/exonuclease/phosphatase,Reverse transcriptase domain n=1 Tax=Cinara cedri TaxID=506608 RepID=A0A5E4N2U6_9HEMI|nr:Endonuclease/exonuclease/phosphatase,Reverse transcriptase domain [Cinara cedri]
MTSNQAYQLTELRIVQHNLNGQHIVVEQLRDYCIDNRVDIALIQEFPSKNKTIKGLDHDPIRCIVGGTGQKPGAAIIVFNAGLEVTVLRNLSSDYFTVITVSIGREIINFVSSYFKFNISTVEFVMKLDAILNELKGETVICADVNAHSPLWMCDASNNTARVKGRKIEDLIERHHLTVHNNNRRTYTYNRVGMGKSNVDVTMTTARLAARITRWKVTKGITDSDHRVITFGLRHSKTVRGGPDTTRFNTDKADWDEFNVNLARELGQATDLMRGDVDVRAAALTAAIRSAAESSIPRKRGPGRLPPPWWNDDLTKSRKSLNNFRNTKDYKVTDRQEYQRLRNKHLGLIRHSKFQMWKSFAESANDKVWGNLYKWVKKGPRTNKVLTALKKDDDTYTTSYLETAEYLLSSLIPTDKDAVPLGRDEIAVSTDTTVELQDVKDAIWRIGVKKSPGIDGITSLILRRAWPLIQTPLRKLYKDCLESATFPDCWKTAVIVAIPKGGDKDLSLPKSYRPVSLLPTLGKALETLIIARLRAEVLVNLSEDQHGFMTGKSTISAIDSLLSWADGRKEKFVIGVFLDITGAFDNLNWEVLFQDVKDLGASQHTLSIIRDYLRNRHAELSIGTATAKCNLTRGCPQGSQLGPILWNLSMDRALKLHRHDRSKIVAYADDLAVVTAGTNINIVRDRLSPMLDRLVNWASERGLSFSPMKTNVMTLKGGLKPGYSINFGNLAVISCSHPLVYHARKFDDFCESYGR